MIWKFSILSQSTDSGMICNTGGSCKSLGGKVFTEGRNNIKALLTCVLPPKFIGVGRFSDVLRGISL